MESMTALAASLIPEAATPRLRQALTVEAAMVVPFLMHVCERARPCWTVAACC